MTRRTHNPEDAVISAIDELVDWQLAQPIVDDYDVDRYDLCPHEGCSLSWHGLPQVGCPGSDAEGPLRGPESVSAGIALPTAPDTLYIGRGVDIDPDAVTWDELSSLGWETLGFISEETEPFWRDAEHVAIAPYVVPREVPVTLTSEELGLGCSFVMIRPDVEITARGGEDLYAEIVTIVRHPLSADEQPIPEAFLHQEGLQLWADGRLLGRVQSYPMLTEETEYTHEFGGQIVHRRRWWTLKCTLIEIENANVGVLGTW